MLVGVLAVTAAFVAAELALATVSMRRGSKDVAAIAILSALATSSTICLFTAALVSLGMPV